MYSVELITKEMTLETLLTFYDHKKIEGFCKKCNNYNNIWSCPPHNFNTLNHLKQYSRATIILRKINFDLDKVNKDDVMAIFQKERRLFSDELLGREEEGTEVLIAGNCYQCETCNRIHNKACILQDRMRYSLEALGLSVGDLCEYCGVKLHWSKGEISPYIVTVGGILKK